MQQPTQLKKESSKEGPRLPPHRLPRLNVYNPVQKILKSVADFLSQVFYIWVIFNLYKF